MIDKIKTIGKIKVEKDRVSIELSPDLCKYYTWFAKKETWNTLPLFQPRYGAHVSIVLPKIHKIEQDLRQIIPEYHNKEVDIWYYLDMFLGGKAGGFTNFWSRVECKEIEEIKTKVGITESPNYKGPHITFCSTKHSTRK